MKTTSTETRTDRIVDGGMTPAADAMAQAALPARNIPGLDDSLSKLVSEAWLAKQKDAEPPKQRGRVCVFYTRFSSDSQNETSIKRQIDFCTAYANGRNMTPMPGGHIFEDHAKSGAFLVERDALAAMLAAARERKFDVLLVENLDRLSRDLVDVITIHRNLHDLGIEIHTSASGAGKVDNVKAVFDGIVAKMHRDRLLELTSTGRWRAAINGRNVGRAPFGYRLTGTAGELGVDQEAKKWVVQIYEWYDQGVPPLRIVQILNAKKIAPSYGENWSVSALVGNAVAGTGLLRNPRYVGVFVYGRTKVRTVAEDDRKKKITQARAKRDWIYVSKPEWKILDEELWGRVIARLNSRSEGRQPAKPREKNSTHHTLIFHGSYFCSCGAPMRSGFTSSKYRHLLCADASEKALCTEGRRLSAAFVEAEILREIRENILNPAALPLFVEAHIENTRRIAEEMERRRTDLSRQIEEINEDMQQSFRGADEEDIEKARRRWTSERIALRKELAEFPPPFDLPRVNPASIASLKEQVDALILRVPFVAKTAEDQLLCQALRRLIPRIVIFREPDQKGYDLSIWATYAGFADDPEIASQAGISTKEFPRSCPAPGRGSPMRPERKSELEKKVRSKVHRLDDNDWLVVEQALQGFRHPPSRSLVDAALLYLRTGELRLLPAPYGGETNYRAVRKMVKQGVWRIALRALQHSGSLVVADLDTSPFSRLEQNLGSQSTAEAA